MHFGSFLDSFPAWLFISVHILLLCVGIWAAMKAAKEQKPYAPAFWLYVAVHVGFLLYFAGVFAFKMSVLLEQILVLIMVLWIVIKGRQSQ